MACKIEDNTQWAEEVETQENQTLETEDSKEVSDKNNYSIAKNSDIIQFLPPQLSSQVSKLDAIVQTGIDTLVTTNLSVLASLSNGTTVFDKKEDTSGTPIIIYSGGFFKSGGGKTVSVNVNRHYFLEWLEQELSKAQEDIDKRKAHIEIEIKALGNSGNNKEARANLEEELLDLKTQPDVYLEDATSEGFEASIGSNSTPLLFIDNFGKYLMASGKSEHKANMLRMMDNVFDSGKTTTRRLKGVDKRATQLYIKGFGAHFASTMGESNLKPKDIKNNIENGFFNKVLITFQDTMDKPIPLRSSLDIVEKKDIEKFARAYHTMAGECHFYLGEDAYDIYTEFHKETSNEFVRRYNNNEDLAGLIIRLLKISKRVACIFEIASQCEGYDPLGVVCEGNEDHRIKIPISAENMNRAIAFIEYLKEEHISKIMAYAESKNGKLSKSDTVLNKIQKLYEKKRKDSTTVINVRSIQQSLSSSQRMKAPELKSILSQLVLDNKIEGDSDGNYTLLP